MKKTNDPPRIDIVVPCFNEEEALASTTQALLTVLGDLAGSGKISERSRVVYVDDGSRDGTWSLIECLSGEHPNVSGIRLSRNVGHQNALMAGLLEADGDALISIDADLQDDVAAIAKMVDHYLAGADIVYGVRSSRVVDSRFKRGTARFFYSILQRMGVNIIPDHADFRLISRRTIEALRQFGESNLFLRGLVCLIGYPSAVVYYERHARVYGESHYNLRRMVSLAVNGVTSFSIFPLRLVSLTGLIVAAASFALGIWSLAAQAFGFGTVPGWASTVVPIYFLGGVQILSIGIVGEYVGKAYLEIKRRPRYFVETKTTDS